MQLKIKLDVYFLAAAFWIHYKCWHARPFSRAQKEEEKRWFVEKRQLFSGGFIAKNEF